MQLGKAARLRQDLPGAAHTLGAALAQLRAASAGSNVALAECTSAAAMAELDCQRFAAAAQLCGASLPLFARLYPHPHPLGSLQRLLYGELAVFLGPVGGSQAALEALVGARDGLRVSHGADHPLCQKAARSAERLASSLQQGGQ